MDNRNTPRRRTPTNGRNRQRDYIDGRPTPRRRASESASSFQPQAPETDSPNTARTGYRYPENKSRQSNRRRNASAAEYSAAKRNASPRTNHANQTGPGEAPSWYDPQRASGSRTPRATLDTSMENPRWYSQSTNDAYLRGHRPSRKRSKLPFIIAGGIVAATLLILLITNIVSALTTPAPAEEEPLPVTDEQQTSTSLTISFAGDCTLGTDSSFDPSTSFTAVYNDAGDPAYFMKNVADIFSADDYSVVNMEGTLTESESRADKTFAFKGPAEYTEILKSGNIEAASLANNHSHDYGDQSYNDTISALDNAGIVNFGYDRIAYADVKGVKVALIGTYVLAEGLDIKDEMVNNINTARNEGAQVIIVFTHWGTEKETVPDATQVELGHAAIDAGATIVVGSHPHVIQGYEKYNGRYIVYSLGNFCFGGNKNPSDKDCMIFQQTFTVTGNEVTTDDTINVIPCSISSSSGSNNYQPTPAEGDEADRILAKIEESNSSIASLSSEVSGSGSNSSGGSGDSNDSSDSSGGDSA